MINDSFPPRNTDAFIAFAGGSVISIVLFLMAFRVYKGANKPKKLTKILTSQLSRNP
jgi:hypothetical protein